MVQGSREERIRARAHQIWEDEGRAEGNDERHWQQASNEIDAETFADGGGQPGGASGIASSLQPGGMSPGGEPAAGADSLGSVEKAGRGVTGPN
ncbi:DUF2934 domain-containing protein [Rhizobium deserti]|uniref:DUF2934 domain-containing protein n=1 Tax=Rhizobium deserti TaxID=2547961 RepID=A0A4R5U9Q7_9HYPH|nr:DUF2934 domain-containing protein [Rhizobium deserti]TDK31339.1 DUF2934 domain-containing protein [Rhizobium deserti]